MARPKPPSRAPNMCTTSVKNCQIGGRRGRAVLLRRVQAGPGDGQGAAAIGGAALAGASPGRFRSQYPS
eukprot:267948-Prymnesium_polylepis.1